MTGGASRRMGADKAKLLVEGTPMANRLVERLAAARIPITVLGREPVPGAAFFADEQEFAGPLVTLGRFATNRPLAAFTFVAACDMPRFDARIVHLLLTSIGEAEVAVPVVAGRHQPLCALYRASAFSILANVVEEGRRSMMAWIDRLSVSEVVESTFEAASFDTLSIASANSPEEFAKLVR